MIGLIPLGGNATRMNGIPKHLLPVADTFLLQRLMQQMNDAGATDIFIGASRQNMELLRWQPLPGHTAHRVATETMSQTLLHSQQFCGDDTVLFGMPDTYWDTPQVYPHLLREVNARLDPAPIAAVAMWKTPRRFRHKRGMCDAEKWTLKQVIDKPIDTELEWGWGAIVWKPAFWHYINPYDKHVGFALQRALDAGNHVAACRLVGRYYDCGTPDEYYDLIRELEFTDATV